MSYQTYLATQKAWNEASKAARERMLALAGHSKYLAARAFAYLPNYVRDDVIYAYQSSAAPHLHDKAVPSLAKAAP